MEEIMKQRPCGNPECSSSIGIHEGITFGHGELDEYGYWEFPCRTCAADWDARIDETKATIKKQLLQGGKTEEEADKYIAESDWLNIPAWPRQEKTNVSDD